MTVLYKLLPTPSICIDGELNVEKRHAERWNRTAMRHPFSERLSVPYRSVSALSLLVAALFLCTTSLVRSQDPQQTNFPEGPFLDANQKAMSLMMAGMDVKPSGDVDQDFAAMMIPHHQGAIDMARAELAYGKNERLRRIAQEIIVEQKAEIIAMQMAAHTEDRVGELERRWTPEVRRWIMQQ